MQNLDHFWIKSEQLTTFIIQKELNQCLETRLVSPTLSQAVMITALSLFFQDFLYFLFNSNLISNLKPHLKLPHISSPSSYNQLPRHQHFYIINHVLPSINLTNNPAKNPTLDQYHNINKNNSNQISSTHQQNKPIDLPNTQPNIHPTRVNNSSVLTA